MKMKAVAFSLNSQLGRIQNQLRGAPLSRPVWVFSGRTSSAVLQTW